MIIPHRMLSPEALQGLLEEFVTRDGTDYGEREASLQAKVVQVWRQLDLGIVVIVFNEPEGPAQSWPRINCQKSKPVEPMSIQYPKARFSPAKDQFIVVEFRRDEVERGDLARVYDLLSALTASREAAEFGEGRLTFFFSGWDDDPREISEIAEIRAWFGKLTEVFPYWLHFAEKQGNTLPNAFMLLCEGKTETGESGMVAWRFSDLQELTDLVRRLFAAQNGLYERLGLSEEMNERISQEVAQLIQCSLE